MLFIDDALASLWNRAFHSPANHSLAHLENGRGMIGRGIKDNDGFPILKLLTAQPAP
jgi:hypothetical protein